MPLIVETFDPRRDERPPWWEAFRHSAGLHVPWDWDLLRLAPPSAVAVAFDGEDVVAAAVARRNRGVADVRPLGGTAQPSWWTADPVPSPAVPRSLARGLRAQLGFPVLGTLWRELDRDRAVALGGVRFKCRINPVALLPIEWSDEEGWLRTLSSKRRRTLRATARAVARDEGLRLADGPVGDLDADALIRLIRLNEVKYNGPRHQSRMSDAWLRGLFRRRDVRALSYHEADGRMLAAFTLIDHPTWPVVHRWGIVPAEEGARKDLYFHAYLRTVAWATSAGKQGLLLGKGLPDIKRRLGCRIEDRYAVLVADGL
ncbi:hypothetical protein [Streptomyces sp. NBC_01089]|uniref:hypothetical protein n=1 Tax=Streptomyces sp. NBC_01089 TaxID=2903747 RepID=UPI003867B15D|nr:hypothetical protein OG510_10570 [Streptomyces sp. NBC_01089]